MSSDEETKTDFSPGRSHHLDFHPQSFIDVGSWLTAQERRPTVSSSSQTVAPPPSAFTSRRSALALIIAVVVGVVLLLWGTNAYTYRKAHAHATRSREFQSRIVQLEAEAKTAGRGETPKYTYGTGNNCPGGELLDTCWFKVGLGNCAKDVFDDPMGAAENAGRQAWDTTAEAVEAVGNNVHQLGMEVHSFGMAALQFLGVSGGSS